jgi:hypothetical protein
MEQDTRKDLIDKMFDAALKEKFSQLARKYDWDLLVDIWAEISKNGGVIKYFAKGEWEPKMTIDQALDRLEEYCHSVESLIQKRLEEGKRRRK